MRVYVVSDTWAIYSVEIAKETSKCLMIAKDTKKDHWRESYYIGDRVHKEKDHWFKTLPEALEFLAGLHQKNVEGLSARLDDARSRQATFLAAKERFDTGTRP